MLQPGKSAVAPVADFEWYDGSKSGSYGTSHEVTLLAFAYVQHAESAVGGIGTVKRLFSQVCEDGCNVKILQRISLSNLKTRAAARKKRSRPGGRLQVVRREQVGL